MATIRIAPLALLVVLALGGGSAVAQPQPAVEEARQHADRGQEAIAASDFRRALEEYQEAYRLYPNGLILINVARAQSGLGRITAAIETLRRVLADESIEPARNREVQAEVARLRGLLAVVQIEVSLPGAAVSVNGALVGTSPVTEPLRLDPGSTVVEATLAGHPTARWSGELRATERQTVTLALASAAQLGDAPAGLEPGPGRARTPHPPASSPGDLTRTLFWSSVIGAGAFTAVGTIFGLLTAIDHGHYDDLGGCPAHPATPDENRACDLQDRGLTRAGVSTVFFIGAALAAGAAIYLYVQLDGHLTAERLQALGEPALRF